MATITGSGTTDDIEQPNEPLLNNSTEQFHDYDDDDLPIGQHNRAGKPAVRVLATTAGSVIFLVCLVAMILTGGQQQEHPQASEDYNAAAAAAGYVSRGKAQGVSEKTSEIIGSVGKQSGYKSNDDMLMWERSAYHFQPQKNWMNDPNGPLYHKGWYHLFYQYNPDSAIWGNITWGHAVSTDMVNWYNLPLAMIPDQWYDWNGVWTGSATLLPNGDIIMLYTGDTNEYVQVQNLAYPTNLSDPLLLNWTKYSGNPVMTPPTGIAPKDFRDPTTAWIGLDGLWRVLIGSKINKTGFALVYKTDNFTTFELDQGNHHVLHSVAGVGMWECVDFYPVNMTGTDIGLDTSVNGDGVKHVLKASMDDDKHDWYAIGVYNEMNDTWTPDDSTMDVGIGLRVDYGKYYASKTFYDQNKERRILWGWVGETDSEADDIDKGWASVQSVPRVVSYDNKTGTNIIQWPIQELDKLRTNVTEFHDIIIEAGSVVDLNISSASQLDIVAEFVVDTSTAFNSTSEINNCTATGVRGAVGPFGILVLTDDQLTELTPVYFYIGVTSDGTINNWFCTDKSRSTLAEDVDKQVYGGPVPVLDDENYTMRILVDHSVVEAYGQGGRTCITSRIYPTQAINSAARLYLFNNATDLNVTASIKVHRMESATIIPYPFDQI